MTEPYEASAETDPRPMSAPPDKRPRRALVAVVGVVALAAAFGAWLATDRATAPNLAAAASSTTATRAAASGTPVAASATASLSVGALTATAKLANTLIPLPAGASAKTTSGASADGSLTLDQFLKTLYPTSTTERTFLQQRGFVGAATRSMATATGQEVSIYLVEFGSLGKAHYYNLTLAAPLETDPKYASYTQFTVPDFEDSWGFENPTLDSHGDTETYIYGEIGSVAIMVDCLTPAKFDRADLLTLVNQQAARLSAYASVN